MDSLRLAEPYAVTDEILTRMDTGNERVRQFNVEFIREVVVVPAAE
jgi:hypothetical protein